MYIKKITIQGFKTYKNTTVIEELSPKLNVVVGRNGSGKSNFFSAIRFVLSDAYTHMTREERQALIHEGSGTVMSAYVEIVFDNTDRRFPLQKNEIAIRRTIGMKKDDYSLDGKSATRSDIMNLLESAGFSRSNPYYIVPQGRITYLTNSKDSERLQLLKEVSGAKLFESKLKESNKEMANSSFKMEKIDENMDKLQQKLSDLQIESDSLREFQQLERSKKTYEFNIFDRELQSLHTEIEEKEEQYESLLVASKADIHDLEKRELVCQKLQESIEDLSSSLKVATIEKDQCEADQQRVLELIAAKTAVKIESEEALASIEKSTELDMANIIQLQKDLEQNKAVLENEILPELNALKQEEVSSSNQLSELVTAQRLLYSKQHMFSQFNSKPQRDSWLQNEIGVTRQELANRIGQLQEIETSVRRAEADLNRCQSQLEQYESAFDESQHLTKLESLEEEMQIYKAKLSTLIDERKLLWRNEMKLRSLRDSAENDLANANQKLAKTMDRSQSNALQAVSDITKRLNLEDSVFGPLVDLFTVPDKYKTAVEVVAGNSLFHLVVDTDETASIIMRELARTKGGRITIVPLNRIHSNSPTFPEQDSHEYIPLIKKLRYDHETVGKAINQVFGKTIVCNNLHRASELARLYGLNAITLDGDRATTKGILSGGFRQYKHARLDNLNLRAKKKKDFENAVQELRSCLSKIKDLDGDIASATEALDRKCQELDNHRSILEPHKIERTKLVNQITSLKTELASSQKIVNSSSAVISSLEQKLLSYQSELESEFASALSPEESRRLDDLTMKIKEAEEKYNEVVENLTTLETEMAEYDDRNKTIQEQIKNYEQPLQVNDMKKKKFELKLLHDELGDLQGKADILNDKVHTAQSEFERLATKLEEAQSDIEQANKKQISILKRIETVSKNAEKLLVEKSLLDNRREELQEKVRSLGVLPEEAFKKSTFESLSTDDLFQNLNRINSELKKFSHVNKKALEQFGIFAKEKEDLVARKEELELSKDSILNLMNSLEQQKDAAIKRSFEVVSKSFSEIFERLVPHGKGELVIKRRESGEVTQSDESIENYVGVSILVSFNSKEDEQQHIEQLSGGQKSICAIALILAIQSCDPAPFYLFDEIDANLDTQYRTAVAAVIESLALNAQFICTTFRSEMLLVANNFYGVSFGNKVSFVQQIEQEHALSFVETEQ